MLWWTLRKFKSTDPNTRCAAAWELGESGRPEAAEALLRSCDDPNPDVRLAVAKGLGVFVLTLQKREKLAAIGRATRLSPNDLRAMQDAIAELLRLAVKEEEADPGAPVTGNERAAVVRRDEIRRGGFGEPYCSDACYEEAGRAMATARLTGAAGACAYCQSPVGPRHVGLVKRGGRVLICESCEDRVQAEIQALSRCCLCEAPLD